MKVTLRNIDTVTTSAVELPAGATASDLLERAGVDASLASLNRSGKALRLSEVLNDGDVVNISTADIRGEAVTKWSDHRYLLHPNDPDKLFPSDWHCHDYENGEKIDLYNGRRYKKTQYTGKKVNKKCLAHLQAKFACYKPKRS